MDRTNSPRGLYHVWNPSFAQLDPHAWSVGVCSVYMACQDKKPLHVTHVAAMTVYLSSIDGGEVGAIVDQEQPWNLDGGLLDATFKNHNISLLERACGEHFMKFWRDWMNDVGRHKYSDVVSPFAV